jgi:uncharacterized membrane protein
MNKRITTQQIVGTGLLLALEIITQIIGNYLQIGPVNFNLSLVAVVLAAVLYGPLSGAVLGFFNGIIVLFSPSTLGLFMPISPVGTVLACLLKCTLAGLAAGFIFKLFKNKLNIVGLILASILVPVINTGLFSVFALLFFRPFLESGVNETFPNIGAFLIFGVIGINFIVEIVSTTVISTPLGMVLLKREKVAK